MATSTPTPAEDIVTRLATNALGTAGTDLFVDFEPPGLSNSVNVVVYNTGGFDPGTVAGKTFDHPTVQVVVIGPIDGVQAAQQRAQAIKETFFRGDSQPYVGFDLAPVSMDPSITQFSMTVNGQSLEYFHGPRVTQSLEWPGQGPGEVRIEMSPGIGTPMRVERGPWAWFRALDSARMRAGSQPEHFEVTFDLGGRTATYELVARSAYNPFKLDALSKFSCPQRLTQ